MGDESRDCAVATFAKKPQSINDDLGCNDKIRAATKRGSKPRFLVVEKRVDLPGRQMVMDARYPQQSRLSAHACHQFRQSREIFFQPGHDRLRALRIAGSSLVCGAPLDSP
jgi:hypothetical protein